MSVSETSKQLHTILPRGTAAADPAGRGARASAGGTRAPFCICSFSQAAASVSPTSRTPAIRPARGIAKRLWIDAGGFIDGSVELGEQGGLEGRAAAGAQHD